MENSPLPETLEEARAQEREVEHWLVHEANFTHETAIKYAAILGSVGCDTLGRC